MDIPKDLRYTNTHEWVRLDDDGLVVVGITDFAQSQLSDLTYVELPAVGDQFTSQEEAAVVESVKAASDIYAPIDGKVAEVNEALLDHPEAINNAPFTEGWLFKLTPLDENALDDLLDAAAYEELVPNDE